MAKVTITCACGVVDSGPDTQALLDKGWKEIIYCHCPTCECADFYCPKCLPPTQATVPWSDGDIVPVYTPKPAQPHTD
jgi:hypothetical protein